MRRNDWKYLLDALLFVDVTSLVAIGLILSFVVPSGQGPEGSKFFMGIHRHDWGDIHFFLGLLMIGLLALHVWLNWAWVLSTTKSTFGDSWEKALWSLSCAWVLVLLLGWLVVKL